MTEIDNGFLEVVQIIEKAHNNAYRSVNKELILMYKDIGKFISKKSGEAKYGDGYINSLADYIQKNFLGSKDLIDAGFTA